MQLSELEQAFTDYRARVDEIAGSGRWGDFADLFTADATYRRAGHPDAVGREAIRGWVLTSMTTFPGTMLERHEVVWQAFDPSHDRVVLELRNTLRDPGDGSVHSACSTTLLRHGHDGLWAYAEDSHNPLAYRTMWRSWTRAALRAGTLDADDATTMSFLIGETAVDGSATATDVA
ncbi:nuclear transport factor 2 family protein [Nocardioides aurantiacus]|uniref:SnoaL-like protein n=1 Tax=Nocardioides aurantiacus TaxID=86796 RepID=A0A3N2CRV3_9ACTN|nr:nuclear transport factor 2 family protein [Nocardioides aurantiacus]ROR90088.1 SnoaL-like protein [Nocardioides aurantiacus]